MVDTPTPPQRSPVQGNDRDIDRLGEDLANMKLMYERDTGRRPPGPPACRLCHEVGHIARFCPYQPTVHCMDIESDWEEGANSNTDTSEDEGGAEVYTKNVVATFRSRLNLESEYGRL